MGELYVKQPRCPKCLHHGYKEGRASDGRPMFSCQRCDHVWTNGKTGGEFTKARGEQ